MKLVSETLELLLIFRECTNQHGHPGETVVYYGITLREVWSTIGVNMSQHKVTNVLQTLRGVLVICSCKLHQ